MSVIIFSGIIYYNRSFQYLINAHLIHLRYDHIYMILN